MATLIQANCSPTSGVTSAIPRCPPSPPFQSFNCAHLIFCIDHGSITGTRSYRSDLEKIANLPRESPSEERFKVLPSENLKPVHEDSHIYFCGLNETTDHVSASGDVRSDTIEDLVFHDFELSFRQDFAEPLLTVKSDEYQDPSVWSGAESVFDSDLNPETQISRISGNDEPEYLTLSCIPYGAHPHVFSEPDPGCENEIESIYGLYSARDFRVESISSKTPSRPIISVPFPNLQPSHSTATPEVYLGSIAEMALDKHRTDLPEEINSLRKDSDQETALRREWTLRRTAIDLEIGKLKSGPLLGARIQGRRPGERPFEDSSTSSPSAATVAISHPDPAPQPPPDDDSSTETDFTTPFDSFENDLQPARHNFLVDAGSSFDTPRFDPVQAEDLYLPSANVGEINQAVLPAMLQPTGSTVFPSYNDPLQNPLDSWAPFTADETSWDSDIAQFLAATFGDSTPIGYSGYPNNGGDAGAFGANTDHDELEYIREPTVYSSGFEQQGTSHQESAMASQVHFGTMACLALREYNNTELFSKVHLPGFRLSQELPRLPPPSMPSPIASEPDLERSSVAVADNDEESLIASKDIDLSFSERNILTGGKRQRTQSSRAAAPVPASKKASGSTLLHHKLLQFPQDTEIKTRTERIGATPQDQIQLLGSTFYVIKCSRFGIQLPLIVVVGNRSVYGQFNGGERAARIHRIMPWSSLAGVGTATARHHY
ncbi:hypothetical protein C8R44DRAFT_740655 [Mycena epipterygia]|nr:hypothetical protein C8R44DRAFT_740655 [Mycena epipterygia]